MRLALLMDFPSPHFVGILDALQRRTDISGEVVYFRPGAPERSWENTPGLLPFQIAADSKDRSAISNIRYVIRAMKTVRADLWIVNSCYTAPETWAAIKSLKGNSVPWVYMNEAVRVRKGLDSVKRFCLRSMLCGASGVIGMGRDAEAQYAELLGGQLPSISIPYYLDLSEFLEFPPAHAPEPPGPIRFLIAAQMIHRKGFDVLFEACKRLPNAGWALTVVGDGHLRRKWESSFLDQFGQDKISFLGNVAYADRANYFEGHHVFVFPSRWDGWGVAPIEAMAAGLPVISSDRVMSMREFIQDDVNGYLVPSEDAAEFARRMESFITDPSRVCRMGQAARASLAGYTPEAGAERLVTFLRDLVSSSNPSVIHKPESTVEDWSTPLTWRSLTDPPRQSERLLKKCRAYAKSSVIRFSLALRRSFSAKSNRILVYHLILPEDRQRFEDHILFLKDHYRVVTCDTLHKERCTPSSPPLAAVTFDDAFRVLMGEALDVLEKHGVKATFFIPTGFVSSCKDAKRAAEFSMRAHYYQLPLEPMTPDDLRTLERTGHEIGSHGVSHVRMSTLSSEAAVHDLRNSQERLSDWLDHPVTGYAYPYGDHSNRFGRPSEWVAAARYDYGVTLRRGPVNGTSNSMELPREHTEGNWKIADLEYFLHG